MVTNVGAASHGTASGYGYYVYYTPGPSFGFGPGESSSDSFTYTIRDYYGQTDTATVTVNAVEVTGYTVEWQKPDETWQALGDDDVSWSHDQLRWTPHYNFDPQYFSGAALWRKPWGEPWGWSQFAASGGEQITTRADVGEWAVQAQVRFAGMPWQSPFSTRQETEGWRLTAQIASIEWTAHSNPQQAADLQWVGSDIMHIFPDAAAPHLGARPMVDVLVQVQPQLAGIPVVMEWYDVDDPDHDGPIDTTDPPADQPGVNTPDNFITTVNALLTPPPASDANGSIRTSFDIGSLQPGNNFRIAVAGRAERLALVKALARSDDARLFYDKNNNNAFEQGPDEVCMEASTYHMGIRATPRLIVWRKLHVEVDSMGAVAGNTVTGQITQVALDLVNMRATVTTNQTLDDSANRFVPGQLTSNNRDFNVISNTFGVNFTVTVQVYDGPTGPEFPAQGPFILIDDDELVDTTDVPMPDTTELGNAMAQAYVMVLFDVGDGNNEVNFIRNVETGDDCVAAQDWDSLAQNADRFWVTYVLGAFQGETLLDRDPDTEVAPEAGATVHRGGSLIYLETIRDWAGDLAWVAERDTVVHEVAHAVGRIVGETPPVTRWGEGVPSRYTESSLKAIRMSEKPWSRTPP